MREEKQKSESFESKKNKSLENRKDGKKNGPSPN
jgi:hypothetical protein